MGTCASPKPVLCLILLHFHTIITIALQINTYVLKNITEYFIYFLKQCATVKKNTLKKSHYLF